jgi:hypothetical protein
VAYSRDAVYGLLTEILFDIDSSVGKRVSSRGLKTRTRLERY